MKELIRFLVVCLLLAMQDVSATEVKDLFSPEIIAHSQSREDRNLAIREALVIVLNRVVASKGLMLNSAIREALNNAASYVDRYQYIQMDSDSGNISQQKMKISFNKDAVIALMQRNKLVVWDNKRDEVLVWIALEQRRKQHLFDAEQDTKLNKALLTAARRKGIPVLLPLMDLEDRLAISVEDIASANAEKIKAISRRYGVSAVLSGKMIKRRLCWRSEWTLNFNHTVEQWDIPCENLQASLSTAFQRVYEHLSVINAVKPK